MMLIEDVRELERRVMGGRVSMNWMRRSHKEKRGRSSELL